ncbi:serine protease inhibitor swm-1-like [Pieris rapae]|uniref:serine protease inhibitor swm-1-like n=1 Tax=Pieris rapae TaxID=64459 RepID=UPI001E27BA0A|nr:serine protease inhibitor swm-1-like [Pieris rapae]
MRQIIFLFLFVGAQSVYVAKDECPTNEEYLLCGTSCPFNCTSPQGPVDCVDDCVEGCFCKSGFLRNDTGICVEADQCLKGNRSQCGQHEEFLYCGCQSTCSTPDPVDCGCGVGCFCKAGYVWDETVNKCVMLDNCTVEQCFNENEVFDLCNASCEPSCIDPEPICSKACTSGCICASGLLRDADNTCVSVDKCPRNGTVPGPLGKYFDTISKILHLSIV